MGAREGEASDMSWAIYPFTPLNTSQEFPNPRKTIREDGFVAK
jgi:hypothetical protein